MTGAIQTPLCDHENGLVLRPLSRQTPEQRFCGIWYDCPHCHFSKLIPSKGLLAQLAAQTVIQHDLFSGDDHA